MINFRFILYTGMLVWLGGQALFLPLPAEAQRVCPFGKFEVDLPLIGLKGTPICDFVASTDNPLTEFMSVIIDGMIAIVILAGLMSMVIGAYLYMTAGGEANRVDMAKGFIKTALLAIVLALTAYLILNTISPQFVPTKDPNLNING